jgi:hypothetical protein
MKRAPLAKKEATPRQGTGGKPPSQDHSPIIKAPRMGSSTVVNSQSQMVMYMKCKKTNPLQHTMTAMQHT